jgi:hypothetical protein
MVQPHIPQLLYVDQRNHQYEHAAGQLLYCILVIVVYGLKKSPIGRKKMVITRRSQKGRTNGHEFPWHPL